jgi:hypothetical protein
MARLHGMGPGHGIFGHADVLRILRAGEGTLVGDAERRVRKRIFGLQLAGSFGGFDRFCMFRDFAVADRQREVGQRKALVDRDDPLEALDGCGVIPLVLELFALVVQVVNAVSHRRAPPNCS